LKYRGLHRIFCRICSVAVFFVEFIFYKMLVILSAGIFELYSKNCFQSKHFM
jgi:hypothetical protein